MRHHRTQHAGSLMSHGPPGLGNATIETTPLATARHFGAALVDPATFGRRPATVRAVA
ncbi:MAG: hypothetical protein KBD27_00020 [Candidatus Moranbacteria bacterium]|nr:hypothetical protein [Candidatus Moranbacteria bacterium]